MTEFYQGFIGCVTLLGGLCAFIYWVFALMEKRLELKIDHSLSVFQLDLESLSSSLNSVASSVKIIADEVQEQRKRTDHLYMFVLDSVNKKERSVKK